MKTMKQLLEKENLLYSLIMYDDIRWNCVLSPQFIIGKNNKLIKCYIGDISNKSNEEDYTNVVGIYVDYKNYEKIDHSNIYIFIHDYDFEFDEEILKIIGELRRQYTYKFNKEVGRGHVHLTKYNFEEINMKYEK